MNKTYTNPVTISCIFICILLLLNLINISDRNKFHSILEKKQITKIEGIIKSSPIKLSNNKYYYAKLKCLKVFYKNNISSECNGDITVYLPVKMVEAYFPGKLFTKNNSNQNYVYEEGGFYKFNGKFINDVFYIEDCFCNKWDSSFLSKIYLLRANIRIYIKRLMFKWGDAGGFFMALITGSREYTNEDVKSNFRNSGLSHILALSGMHLSLLSGLAAFIGNKTKRLKVSYLIRIIAILLFVFIAGFSPSLLRAFISFCLLLFYSIINNKKMDMIYIVCLSFIIQINIDPISINNTGFILSYGALFGILLFNNFFKKVLNKIMPDKISESLSASTAAQLLTSPFSLNLFGEIYPIGILASSIVSPLVTFFIYTGLFLFLICLICPFFVEVSGFFMNLLYTVISFLVKLFSYFPKLKI